MIICHRVQGDTGRKHFWFVEHIVGGVVMLSFSFVPFAAGAVAHRFGCYRHDGTVDGQICVRCVGRISVSCPCAWVGCFRFCVFVHVIIVATWPGLTVGRWIVARRAGTIVADHFFVFDQIVQTIFQLNAIQNEIFIFAIAHHIIHANDVLFVGILRVAHNGGARLDPGVAALFVHDAIVMRQHLPFVDHCGNEKRFSGIMVSPRSCVQPTSICADGILTIQMVFPQFIGILSMTQIVQIPAGQLFWRIVEQFGYSVPQKNENFNEFEIWMRAKWQTWIAWDRSIHTLVRNGLSWNWNWFVWRTCRSPSEFRARMVAAERWPMQPCPIAVAVTFACAKMCTADEVCTASRPPETICRAKQKKENGTSADIIRLNSARSCAAKQNQNQTRFARWPISPCATFNRTLRFVSYFSCLQIHT